MHHDVADTVIQWVNVLRTDPDNRFAHGLLSRIVGISPNRLEALSADTLIYAGLLLTEGTGLLLRKRRPEYFTIVTTGGLIPLELYEIGRHLTAGKVIVLLVNAAIVAYLLSVFGVVGL
jgi:uncharacterized membrane protein (DUF2068 family)